MSPRSVYVVHGDRGSRRALAERLVRETAIDVVLPEDGDLREHEERPLHRGAGRGVRGLGHGRPLTDEGLGELRDLLLRVQGERRRLLTAEDVAVAWFGPDVAAEQVAEARALLETAPTVFEPDRRRPYRYRPVPRASPQTGPTPPADVLLLLARHVTESVAGPYRTSVHADEHRVVLRYSYPDVAAPLARAAIAAVERASGWRVTIHPHARQASLAARAHAAIPSDIATGAPSFFFETRSVRLAIGREVPDGADAVAAFEAETGWTLDLHVEESLRDGPRATAIDHGRAPLRPEDVREILAGAFADVEEDLAPQKATFPAGEVVLHFTHPGMAGAHAERLSEVAQKSGRSVRVHAHPNHQRLTELVQERLPRTWEVLKPPAWVPQEDAVRVSVWTLPPSEESAEVLRGIEAVLGCRVRLVQGD